MHDTDRARSALHALDPSCSRQEWAVIGMAARDAGLSVDDFITWSEGAGNFGGPADCKSAWKSFRPGKVTEATLYAKALEAGWADPARDDDGARRPHQRRQEARKAPGKAQRPTFDFRAVWEAAEPATEAHPYIRRKLGLHFGLRVYRGPLQLGGQALDGALLVPVLDADGNLQSWQAIPPEGKKVNAKGAPTKGGGFIVGGPVRDGGVIYITEGIATAWSAHQASGKPAVCTFGIGNAETVARDLHQRHPSARIIVVCDKGKERDGERIAQAVGGAWVEMPEGAADNDDLNDFHVKVGSLEAVAELLAQAREPARPEYAKLDTLDSDPPPPRRWIVRQWLPRGSVTALFGGGGIGKSLLVQQLATCVANGIECFGQQVTMGPALAFLCEDDNDEIRRRQRDILAHLGRSAAYSASGLHMQGRAGLDNVLMTFGPERTPVPGAFMSEVERECERIRPVLLVLDNIAQLFGGLENDRHEVTVFANTLTGLARRFDCAVLLLGHVAKAQGSEFSGSTAWEAAVRTRLWMERRDDGLIELHKRKANYAAQGSVLFEYQAGALAEVDTSRDGAADSLLMAQAQALVLELLAQFTARQVATSHHPTARNNLVRLAQKEGQLRGTPPVTADRALAALIDAGRIVPNSELGWRGSDRHKARGLALAGAGGGADADPEADQ